MSSRAILLGTGTSNGIPSLGKQYSEEFLANPKNHRTRCAMVLQGPTGNVLFDCGPEIRIQLIREGIFDLEAVFISHTHADHIMGMDDLRSLCLKTNEPIAVYTAPNYQEDIKRIYPYAFREFPDGIWVPRFDLRDVPEKITLGGLTIETFWVDHGPIKVLAIRVNDFAYVTDVSSIPESAMKKLQNLEFLVLDAVRIRPHPNHFHLERALEVAKEIRAKQTYLTHLSDDFDHDITNAQLPSGIELAWDGLAIDI